MPVSMTSEEMSEMLVRLTEEEGLSGQEAMVRIAMAAGLVTAPVAPIDVTPVEIEPEATVVEPDVADYLGEVQARLSDPAVLARATVLAHERGLDFNTITFGELTDLVNDAQTAGDDAGGGAETPA